MCCRTYYAVEAVEGGVEVGLLTQAVHLYKHLCQEYSQEGEFSIIYKEKNVRDVRDTISHIYLN